MFTGVFPLCSFFKAVSGYVCPYFYILKFPGLLINPDNLPIVFFYVWLCLFPKSSYLLHVIYVDFWDFSILAFGIFSEDFVILSVPLYIG